MDERAFILRCRTCRYVIGGTRCSVLRSGNGSNFLTDVYEADDGRECTMYDRRPDSLMRRFAKGLGII